MCVSVCVHDRKGKEINRPKIHLHEVDVHTMCTRMQTNTHICMHTHSGIHFSTRYNPLLLGYLTWSASETMKETGLTQGTSLCCIYLTWRLHWNVLQCQWAVNIQGYGLFITTVSQPVGYHVHCEPVILQLLLIVSDEYLAYMCRCICFVAVQGITTTQILVENVECHMR